MLLNNLNEGGSAGKDEIDYSTILREPCEKKNKVYRTHNSYLLFGKCEPSNLIQELIALSSIDN